VSAAGAWLLVAQSSGGFFRDRSHDDSCVANNGICPGWAWDNFDRYTHPFVEHLELVLISTGAGFLIASALALVAHRRRWLIAPVTQVSAILYTIPSLAAFFLLLPLTGRGTTTAVIALCSYTLLILFRNTLAGLDGVPEDARDAGRGMGYTDRQLLWRVEVPLAAPAILAGLRIALTTTVGLAALAFYAGAGGLGESLASQKDFKTNVVLAGGLCVVMAAALDGLVLLLQRLVTPWTRSRPA
jgi:osmoprotectant transport system permease protein